MAGVSITALRASSVQPGDRVIILGLGVVGNLAAQMFQLAGASVLGLDVNPHRLEVARACGIENVFNSSLRDPVGAVREWSGDGKGAEVVVEAVGRSELIAQAVQMTRRHGETILLGSPRARVQLDVTPMLLRIHLEGIQMIGGLEWTYPLSDKTGNSRVTIEGNYKQILDWIIAGKLVVDPLISHVYLPKNCQEAYSGLAQRNAEQIAVLFDWRELSGDQY
jgi:threonine dehydrogenase-like Zn-dependent dehydrogenase